MSEYQYYEFLAVDRPLDAREQAAVRALSTRAQISATSFTNEYHWGDFRGDPLQLMERYYDAHLYFANWGSRTLMVRLPLGVLEVEAVEPYLVDPLVTAWDTAGHLILGLHSDHEDAEFFGVDDLYTLAGLVGVRAELAAGDLRPLYLGWLAAQGTWDRDEGAFGSDNEDVQEPPVPPGLSELTASQRALADFLRLDPDLLTVAAQASPPSADTRLPAKQLASRVGRIPSGEKDRLLVLVARGESLVAQAELRRRLSSEGVATCDELTRRTVAELLDAAHLIRQEKHRRAEAARVEAEAERERKSAAARERRLAAVSADVEGGWARVEAMIVTKKPAEYDAAVTLLEDLRVVAERADQVGEFGARLAALRTRHQRKPSLVRRIDQAGLFVGSG
ncbi:hypothetical protein LWC33_23355 [Pseudonocardia sp. RS11V-5]|uniref:hypothetical protein n=1 Tax=Pseudonocardia terrae TaxID=2905831 RepID=UPI001E52A3D0|nr:hypothetical protein [Pseudonocardia terrae]MCE3554380.1 hypothetical protein [Pseudonocardia terrae]